MAFLCAVLWLRLWCERPKSQTVIHTWLSKHVLLHQMKRGQKQKQYTHSEERCKKVTQNTATLRISLYSSGQLTCCVKTWCPNGQPASATAAVQRLLIFISDPTTLILSASCNLPDFFSGILLDILLRTKPFLVFYNSSPLAGARQALGAAHKNIPSQLRDMTGNADTSTS